MQRLETGISRIEDLSKFLCPSYMPADVFQPGPDSRVDAKNKLASSLKPLKARPLFWPRFGMGLALTHGNSQSKND
jgi:hypothetical protein